MSASARLGGRPLAILVKILKLPFTRNETGAYAWPTAYRTHPTRADWGALVRVGVLRSAERGLGRSATKLPLIINGTYTCKDSDPATWSQNQASHGLGFCRLYGQTAVLSVGGVPVPAPAPPPPAAGGHPTCSPTPPSSYLISPGHAAPGGTVSFLLGCQAPVANGFTGAFAPLSVLIYDAASFANLRFVNGYLQPISGSFPVRPPLVPSYRVVGPHDIDVTLPASILHGSYIPVVVYAHGEVPSMNGLTVP